MSPRQTTKATLLGCKCKTSAECWRWLKEKQAPIVVKGFVSLCQGRVGLFEWHYRYSVTDAKHRSQGSVKHVLRFLSMQDSVARTCIGTGIGFNTCTYRPIKAFLKRNGFRRSSSGSWLPPAATCRQCPNYLACVIQDSKVED
jgi:hypothetical protein